MIILVVNIIIIFISTFNLIFVAVLLCMNIHFYQSTNAFVSYRGLIMFSIGASCPTWPGGLCPPEAKLEAWSSDQIYPILIKLLSPEIY